MRDETPRATLDRTVIRQSQSIDRAMSTADNAKSSDIADNSNDRGDRRAEQCEIPATDEAKRSILAHCRAPIWGIEPRSWMDAMSSTLTQDTIRQIHAGKKTIRLSSKVNLLACLVRRSVRAMPGLLPIESLRSLIPVKKPLTNHEIYERIYAAISERRLAPGTKLSEERLAQTFQVSRPRIREVLSRLSQELLVELRLNRGAYVASPTSRDLRDIFEMRRALELAIAAQLCASPDSQSVAVLRHHLESEDRARQTGDRAMLARLTGEFHIRLAEITDNRMFADSLRRLVTLTSLVISQNDSLATSACPADEHASIVAAIEAGDVRRGERLMTAHLHHVEQGIELPSTNAPELDFKQIFALAPPTPLAPPAGAAKRTGRTRKRST